MRDFSSAAYRALIAALQSSYEMVTIADLCRRRRAERIAALRHDVDRRLANAANCAELAAAAKVNATFYFRYPYTFQPHIIKRIAALGHEVGYHYEVVSKTHGNLKLAAELFGRELEEFRHLCPVTTACMHGSPLSRWDSRELWKERALSDYGLDAEPYLSIDYTSVGYLTDTGRGWNKPGVAVRDHVHGIRTPSFRSTWDLAAAIRKGELPERLVVTIHPERWNDGLTVWTSDFITQTVKNVGKRALVYARRSERAAYSS